MKKFGFTLAEVLLTIAIIGTVAALTTPTLIKNSRTSEFGTKLASAVSDFENANRTMLQELHRNNVTSFGDIATYMEALSNYIKISPLHVNHSILTYAGEDTYDIKGLNDENNNFQNYLSKNGVIYTVVLASSGTPAGYVYIDVNGSTGANRIGVDVFLFELEPNGSLTPFGANDWTDKCPDSGVDVDGEYCAASIIEHAWNIVYR